MAQLKTGTSIGQTTLNQGGEVTVTLPAVAGTLLTDTDPRLSAVLSGSTGGASVTTYSVTIPSASWTGSSAPYTKTVTVTGLLATDEPIIDVNLTGTYTTDQTTRTNWSKVYDGDTATNSITFYADAVPTADIPVRIKVIR